MTAPPTSWATSTTSDHLMAHLDRDTIAAVNVHHKWVTDQAPDIGPDLAAFLCHVAQVATQAADAITRECATLGAATARKAHR